MAHFKKLEGCDESDMSRWARSVPANNFVSKMLEYKDIELKRLIKKPTEENAAYVRVWERMESLFKEAREMG